MAESNPPLLDLSTLIIRQTVRIDGETYEIKSEEELSVVDETRFNRQTERANELLKGELDEESSVEVRRLLDERCRLVLIAPDEVQRKLVDRQRIRIIRAFVGPQPVAAAAPAATSAEAVETASETPTGAN